MKTRIIFYALWLSLFPGGGIAIHAQKGVEDHSRFGHGEDSVRCITNFSLYREYARQQDFKSALPYWRLVYRECPLASKNIYIDGVKIFRFFIDNTTDQDLQAVYIDSLMQVYDQRIKYYPRDKGDQLGRKGVDLLRYKRDEIGAVEMAYEYLSESIKLEKNESSEAVIATFVTSAITLYQNDKMTAEKVIEDFLVSCRVLNAKIGNPAVDIQMESLRNTLIDNFVSLGFSCDSLEPKFMAFYEKYMENEQALYTIIDVMKKSSCNNSEAYYKAAQEAHNLSPTAESAGALGMMSFERGLYKDAARYFKQATQLETDSLKRAEHYYWLAESLFKLNLKSEARNDALKAAELRPDWGNPYILIGRMYIESYNECSGIKLPKAVYWAAVDKFIKAKTVDPGIEGTANQLILTYSKYFPNKEDAFFQNINEGNSYQVECWINETTKARF